LATYRRGGFDGIGYVFAGDEVGTDLDDVRDPATGVIESWQPRLSHSSTPMTKSRRAESESEDAGKKFRDSMKGDISSGLVAATIFFNMAIGHQLTPWWMRAQVMASSVTLFCRTHDT
jgi:hypothetical protein